MTMKPEYFILRLRNVLGIPFKPEKELSRLKISEGATILDFGCGIGSFTLPLANNVGSEGTVYAADLERSAMAVVNRSAQRNGLRNIKTIHTNLPTGLPNQSIDLVLFIGVLPYLKDSKPVLTELHRVLKPTGVLATRHCFRVNRDAVVSTLDSSGLFELREESGHMMSYKPVYL